MKKLLLVLLALTMVISSLAGFVSAESTSAPDDPYYFVNWNEPPEGYDNVTGLPMFYVNPSYTLGDDLPVTWGSYNMETMAQRLKTKMDALPEGMRYITYTAPQSVFRNCNEAVIYLSEEAIDMIRRWIDEFMGMYKEMGGKLDGIVLDLEYVESNYYYIDSNEYKGKNNMLVYNEIVKHPQYQKLRPLLEERGFKFYPNPTEYFPEIYGICPSSGSEYASCRAIWDAVMHDWKAMYLTQAVYEPLIKHFPDAHVDDYDTYNSYAWLRTPGTNGQGSNAGGNTHQAGNGGNVYTYAHRPGPSFFTDDGDLPVSYYKATMEDTAFTAFKWDMLYTKDMVAALEGSEFTAWTTYYDYRIGKAGHAEHTVSGTAYHTETLYHIGMMNPKVFLGYIVSSEVAGETGTKGDAAASKAEYEKRIKNVSDIMNELTRVAGYSDREYIPLDYSWGNAFVLTGMYAGGRNIWRITPDTTQGVTREQFKLQDSDPTFYIDGQTITFPQGKILTETKIEPYGSHGYWVETPAEVLPVITTDADRYEEYPAFLEDFDRYEVGTKFTADIALSAGCWETRVLDRKNASATIAKDEGDPDNRVLELKGEEASLCVIKAPERVTAGDSYAKQQAWQVTVTLPADLSESASVTLLSGSGSGRVSKDGGFKVEGGKLWYGEGEEYKAFAKLDISSGGKFTLRREVDFRNEEALTSSYYVYDADGKLVAKAKDVPMYQLDIPVYGVIMSCVGITGEPIVLDDFKLRAMGMATDFTLYDAELGIEVTEPETAREKDTAYRLSWMNATENDQQYSVVAAYYDSDNNLVSEEVIKDVQMAPNTDGVDTGVVELVEGAASVRVYLKSGTVRKGIPTAVLIAVPVVLVLISAVCWIYVLWTVKRRKAGK